MKIAFISAGVDMEHEDYAQGNLLGTEYQIFGLSKELATRGYEIYILRRWYESKTEIVDNVHILSFKSKNYMNSRLALAFSKLVFSLDSLSVIRNKMDILIFVDPITSFLASTLPIPKILVTHNMLPYGLLPINDAALSLREKLYLSFNKKIQKVLFDRSDMIVALNSEIKSHLDDMGYKTLLIPNGLNIENYSPNYSDKSYILFGGRLAKGKGIDILIEAYSILSKELQDKYTLRIVGFGPEKEYLENLATNLGVRGKTEFISWLISKDFIKQISNCSAFILPSYYETFGNVVIESMALGKPVIASNILGPKDIIIHNLNGFLFERGNAQELKNYLEVVLKDSNLRRNIGRNARQTVENEYTFERIADLYIKLFNQIR